MHLIWWTASSDVTQWLSCIVGNVGTGCKPQHTGQVAPTAQEHHDVTAHSNSDLLDIKRHHFIILSY